VQAAWVVTNEPWLAGVPGLDYLRLGLGYDMSGNDGIDYNASRSYFASHNFLEDVSGLTFQNIGNTRLKWETTRRLTASLEGNFIGNRLNLRLGYFRSTTDHLLMYQQLNYVTGLEHNWANDGAMRNEGFDVTAVAKLLALKDVQWELGASMGHYKNTVTSRRVSVAASDVLFTNEMMKTIPTFTVTTGGARVIHKGVTYNLQAGENTFEGIVFEPGENRVSFASVTDPITVTYQEASI
jgi:outer membrane receptor protein involved in Fe transport